MPDYITAISFDNAVMTYGIHVENEMQKRWDNGEPMYSLSDILYGHEDWYVRQKNQESIDALMGLPVKRRKGNKAANVHDASVS